MSDGHLAATDLINTSAVSVSQIDVYFDWKVEIRGTWTPASGISATVAQKVQAFQGFKSRMSDAASVKIVAPLHAKIMPSLGNNLICIIAAIPSSAPESAIPRGSGGIATCGGVILQSSEFLNVEADIPFPTGVDSLIPSPYVRTLIDSSPVLVARALGAPRKRDDKAIKPTFVRVIFHTRIERSGICWLPGFQ